MMKMMTYAHLYNYVFLSFLQEEVKVKKRKVLAYKSHADFPSDARRDVVRIFLIHPYSLTM